jgi:hypothetical protein
MSDNIVTKSAVSVTEMARMVGLSRARFYQLVRRGTFPPADHDAVTGRPCYFEEKQRQVLEVRRRNCGVDGTPILFYSRRRDLGQQKAAAPRPTRPKAKAGRYADLIDHLAAVKVIVTAAQVEAVVKEKFPNGIEGIDPSVVFLAVHERLQRQNSPGSEGR